MIEMSGRLACSRRCYLGRTVTAKRGLCNHKSFPRALSWRVAARFAARAAPRAARTSSKRAQRQLQNKGRVRKS